MPNMIMARPTRVATRPARALLAALLGSALLALAATPAGAQSGLAQGPGGPILVVVDPGDPFGDYYSEILRAEGLNEFASVSASSLNAATLAGHDVVVLASMTLSTAQVQTLTDWVGAGGRLIAMRPDQKLAPLLGLSATGSSLSNAYLRIDTSTTAGAGLTGTTMQFHDRADRYSLAGASAVATLYSEAATATANPAVSLRQGIGANGGQAAAFAYDVARSVVGTRQGNLAWAGQKRDGAIDPIRSDDLFFPDWVDFNKIAIPQADEQQRLLANLIIQMSLDRTPLPRFWYLPRGEKAAVVMTGDDHASSAGGTVGQFEWFESVSPAGCSVADWQCVRSTSYAFPGANITRAEATEFQAAGFEIALHMSTNCANFTSESLADAWAVLLADFETAWPSLTRPRTNRTHCIPWSDWAGEPKAEAAHGVRLDTNYYYWPGEWLQNRPGLFTGSGLPMRFADEDGSLIDVYQATTQLTDESGIDIPTHIAALLDGALGSNGYYGVFTANMHTDTADHPGAQAIVAEAQRRGVPVVSAAQMLDWLDGRNDSSFGNLSFSAGELRFSVNAASGSRGLEAMVPTSAGGRSLASLTRGGQPVGLTSRTVKGIEYATFGAAGGSYVARYGPDQVAPDTTITALTIAGSATTASFAATETGARFECSLDAGAFAPCTSPATFAPLAPGAHTLRVRAIDSAGNVDATAAERAFTVSGASSNPGGGSSPDGSNPGSAPTDRTAPRVTIARRTVTASRNGSVTLRVTCPRGEVRCSVDVQLKRKGRRLARTAITISGGKSANVVLRLTGSARAQLTRARKLSVDALLTARDAAGNRATSKATIRLLAPGRR
jgi:hypothetical protein